MTAALQLVRLVCWKEELAKQRADEITALGYRVEAASLRVSGAFITHFRNLNPAAVIIDLDRMPSHGREVAIVLRASKTTRHIPIVFAGGAEEKVERLHAELPDAIFTGWKKLAPALKRAIAAPPINPIHLTPHMQRWGDSSLPRKLGISAGMEVALLCHDDDGLEESIGELPDGASLQHRIGSKTRLILYAVHTLRELDSAIDHACAHLPKGASFWIVHPKATAKRHRDFTQNDVRALALPRGFVDYKVCSVDAQWSEVYTQKTVRHYGATFPATYASDRWKPLHLNPVDRKSVIYAEYASSWQALSSGCKVGWDWRQLRHLL
jgi:CheY-like chemotaxis protein